MPNKNLKKPCIREVNENLRLVEEGKPLTKSLRYLNQSCQFSKRYKILCQIKGEDCVLFQGHKLKGFNGFKSKEYYQKPEVKARMKEWQKEYNQKPEVKARMKEYHKEYYQKPEVKARMKEWQKEYNQKKKKGINVVSSHNNTYQNLDVKDE